LPLLFWNEGSRLGYINDLAVKLQINDGEKILLRSYTEYIDNKLNLSRELQMPEMQPFGGFPLSKKEVQNRTILFRPSYVDQNLELKVGKYDLTLFYRTSESEQWEEFKNQELSLTIEQSDVDQLNRTWAILVPNGRFFKKAFQQSKIFSYLVIWKSMLDN